MHHIVTPCTGSVESSKVSRALRFLLVGVCFSAFNLTPLDHALASTINNFELACANPQIDAATKADINAIARKFDLQTSPQKCTAVQQKLDAARSLTFDHLNLSSGNLLRGLSNLQQLNLEFNNISDIGFIADLPQLRTLTISNNPIQTLDSLLAIRAENLEELKIENAHLTQLVDLQNATPALKKLHLRGNRVASITPLASTKLEYLDFAGNLLTDLNGIAALPALITLNLYGNNKITDIMPLLDLASLRWVGLGGITLPKTSAVFMGLAQKVGMQGLEVKTFSLLEDITYNRNIKITKDSRVSTPDGRDSADLRKGEKVDFGTLASALIPESGNYGGKGDFISLLNWYLQYQSEITEIRKVRTSGEGAYGAWSIDDFYGFKLKSGKWVILHQNIYGE